MQRESVSVLLPSGRQVHYVQHSWESTAEFQGLVLCKIEDELRAHLGLPQRAPLPAGASWVEWWHGRGHPLRRFWTTESGVHVQHTGELYANRRVHVAAGLDLYSAQKALGLPVRL